MEKQEKNKTEQNPMPLGMILDHAREDMTKSVVALQQKYGLPASLLDVKEGEKDGKCYNVSE